MSKAVSTLYAAFNTETRHSAPWVGLKQHFQQNVSPEDQAQSSEIFLSFCTNILSLFFRIFFIDLTFLLTLLKL